MSTTRRNLFIEQLSQLVSEIEDKETHIQGLQQGLKIIQEQLAEAYRDRKDIQDAATPFIIEVLQSYEKKEITEFERDALLKDRENDLKELDDIIQCYKKAQNDFEERISPLIENIEEMGQKIHSLMLKNKTEAAQLKPETAKHIFSYTRFNLTLFQAPPLSNGDIKSPITLREACQQYLTPSCKGP